MLIDIKRLINTELITAENKYLIRENKQIIPSLIDFMTGRFYIVILFMRRFHSSADFAFQTTSKFLKACLQNKGVVRRLFGSILISYTSEVS